MFRTSLKSVGAQRINIARVPVLNRANWALTPLHRPLALTSSSGFIRFNSSSSSSTGEIKTSLTDFDAPETVAEFASTMTSDQVGYLHSIGMADGWGPTAIIERILEVTHVYTGLPWWATIIAATVGVRLLMFPLYVQASDTAAKMTKAKPELDAVLEEMKNASNTHAQMMTAAKRKKIMKAHGIKMLHQFFPMLQLPIAYGFFQALRKMANHPVEGFSTQGAAWFNDLTAVDPYIGLQLITTAVVIMMIRRGGETGAHTMKPIMKKIMTWVPIASILVTRSFSSAVVLYFAANGIFSFFQTLVLRLGAFRKMVNLPPVPEAPPVSESEPTSIKEWWQKFQAENEKKAVDKMNSTNEKVGAIARKKRMASRLTSENYVKRH